MHHRAPAGGLRTMSVHVSLRSSLHHPLRAAPDGTPQAGTSDRALAGGALRAHALRGGEIRAASPALA
jgi:hypothetical protein